MTTVETTYEEISTEVLRQKFVEHLPTQMSEFSVCVQLGAPKVAASTDLFTRTVLGAPAAVKEGELKPASSFVLKEDEVKKITLTHIITVTKQSLRTEEGRKDLQDLMKQAAQHFARGLDTVGIHGTNPVDGVKLADFATVNIVDNALQAYFDPAVETLDRTIHEASVELDDPNGLALSKAGYSNLSTIYTENGNRKFPESSSKKAFEFIDMTAITARQVGEPGWDGSTSDILAIPGNYSHLLLGLGEITVEESRDATIGGVNLFTSNRVAYLIEAEVRVANLEPKNFAVVRTAPVDPTP